MRLVSYGGEAPLPLPPPRPRASDRRQDGINYQTARMLERFAPVRAHALAHDGLVTIGEVQRVLGLCYATAKRRTAQWVLRGLLVYSGRRGEYRLPERAPVAPTPKRRWNQTHALLIRTGSCDAAELAREVGCSQPTASAFLRFCKSRGQLVHVYEGRFALHPAHVDPVAGEALLRERRRCAEELDRLRSSDDRLTGQ